MSNYLKLTREKLDPTEIHELLAHPTCGAVSIFSGITRADCSASGQKVAHLQYECYEEMALKEIEKICINLREKWPSVHSVAIHHRLNIVAVTEISIIVGTSSAHRADAMAATSWCIDQVKAHVPIWKKEFYTNEPVAVWKENSECFWLKN